MERHEREQNDLNHHFLCHNPLKSCYDQDEHCNPFAVYEDECDNSSISKQEQDDDLGNINNEINELGHDGYDNTNGQCSTAVSKLQI